MTSKVVTSYNLLETFMNIHLDLPELEGTHSSGSEVTYDVVASSHFMNDSNRIDLDVVKVGWISREVFEALTAVIAMTLP